jgi:hypothetical protein
MYSEPVFNNISSTMYCKMIVMWFCFVKDKVLLKQFLKASLKKIDSIHN